MSDVHAHIPTAEVEQDIVDTEQEIAVMEGELRAFEMVPHGSTEYKMAQFRASARREGIKQRQAFIGKLRAILAARSEVPSGFNHHD
jgi:hypothetical protein